MTVRLRPGLSPNPLCPHDRRGCALARRDWHLCCSSSGPTLGKHRGGVLRTRKEPAMRRGLFALLAALSLFAASIASAQESYTQQQQQSTTDAQSQSQTQDPAP